MDRMTAIPPQPTLKPARDAGARREAARVQREGALAQ